MDTLDPKTKLVALLLLLAAAGLFAWFFLRRWREREIARERVWAEDDAMTAAREEEFEDLESQSYLRRWLYLAGLRSSGAPASFVIATIASVLVGVTCAIISSTSGFTAQAVEAAGIVPGGVGDLARPILSAGPWIVLGLWALLPWSIVNAKRKARIREIEQDLPVTLELLATMSESGLAFDSALNKVIESSPADRPLFRELRSFQLETLGGIGRVNCFRRLAKRIEIPSISIFVSALVQAEQIGSGFTLVLRNQADDLRNRRREDANMLAQALTVKLVFPLVICFLPGIFVTTLGPTFLQFIKLTESLSQGR